MTTKTPPPFEPVDAGPHTPLAEAGSLKRNLGVGSIAFMALAGAAPLGAVIAAFPIVVGVSQSRATPLFFILATVILTIFTVGFTKMARHVTNAGAFYSYIQAGLGRLAGTGAATFAVGTYVMLSLALAAYIGQASSDAIVHFNGPTTPWWLWTLVWVLITGILGYRDIELSAKVLGVVLVIEIIVVIVIDVAILINGGAQGHSGDSLNPALLAEGFPSLGLMFAFFSFVGFEATAVFRNEARDPDRTIPRATYLAVVGVGLFYAFSAWAVTVGVGTDSIVTAATDDPTGMVLNLAQTYVSPVMQDVMQVLLITSFFACILTFHNVLTRYAFTMSTKGILPAALKAVSPKHRAPSRASLAVSIVTIALLAAVLIGGLDPVTEVYTWFSGAATLGVIVLMALSSLAVLVFFRSRPAARTGIWATSIAPAVALVFLTVVAYLVVKNFTVLVPSPVVANVLLVVLVATYTVGVAVAMVFRARRPHAYLALDA
ncbi:APC family permease [Mycolicibacterium baixiangningiae]|uniref:APC family permease n=1 Tax=Mycolicibacterium baixiangningiae TaxID=2761578 RepID=UPI0018D0CEEA|nr:APC family permease [Mycolicibacterium baixiangningiae]